MTDFSCDAFVRDVEAVVATAELGPMIVQTYGAMSIPAVVFAAQHPAQVRGLILSNGIVSGSDRPDGWNVVERLAAR